MNQRFLDKCFRFAEKTRRHVYYGMTGGAVRFLGKKLRIPGNRARFLMSYPTREIHFNREAEGVDLSPLEESVCLVWKHNPLEHETLEGKPVKGGTGNSSSGGSSVTGVGKGEAGEGSVNGTNCGGK